MLEYYFQHGTIKSWTELNRSFIIAFVLQLLLNWELHLIFILPISDSGPFLKAWQWNGLTFKAFYFLHCTMAGERGLHFYCEAQLNTCTCDWVCLYVVKPEYLVVWSAYDNLWQLLTANDSLSQLLTAYHSLQPLLTTNNYFWQLFPIAHRHCI